MIVNSRTFAKLSNNCNITCIIYYNEDDVNLIYHYFHIMFHQKILKPFNRLSLNSKYI